MQPKIDWAPFDHPAYLIGRAARLFSRRVDERLARHGVTGAHVPVIRELYTRGPTSQTSLADAVKVEQPTMALLLGRMERDGLVRRAANPVDGRSKLFSLTPLAVGKISAIRKVLTDLSDVMFDGLSPAEVATLAKLLQRAVANVERTDR